MEATQTPLTAIPPTLVRLTTGALALAALCAAGMAAVSLDLLAWAAEGSAVFAESFEDTEPATADIEVPARLVTMLVWAVTGVLWAVWLFSALSRASAIAPLRTPAAATVTLLFLPVVAWVTTKRSLNDLWRTTSAAPSSAPGLHSLLQAWWGIVVLFTIALGVAFALLPADDYDFDGYVRSYRADAVAYALGVVAAGMGAVVTLGLSRRLASALLATPPIPAATTGTITIGPPVSPAELARIRAPLAVRCARWGAWGAAAIAGVYAAITAVVWLAEPDPDVLAGVELGITGPAAMALLVPFVIWLTWFHAAAAVLHTRTGGPSSAWAVASWFVPPFWFVTPWRVFARLAPGSRAVRRAWVAWVLSIVAVVPSAAAGIVGVDDLATWAWYAPVTGCSYALAALCSANFAVATREAAAAAPA